MAEILILKFAALGDVLRTTSIVPGLHAADPNARITWVTAPGARALVELHPGIERVETVATDDVQGLEQLAARLSSVEWERILSFDDEAPLCALATKLAAAAPSARLSGAFENAEGERAYTADVAPWFDMGLLSVHGKEAADRLKVENDRSHPEIFASMLGIPMGKPELPLPPEAMAFGRAFVERECLRDAGLVVGLNTGAGGRWPSKELPPERTVRLAHLLAAEHGPVTFLVLGGRPELERNEEILQGLAAVPGARAVDAGTENSLADFAALVSGCDVLVTSDSLALHVAIARDVPFVAFFAPTSAAEIETYGLGQRVASTAADACSYRPDADNASITPERIAAAVGSVLASHDRIG